MLAECWFLDRHALTAIDLSEYRDPASVHRLLGAPPGYMGHGDRPKIASALAAKPHQVVLFDEVEKAHADVHALLLQILDEGRLTTGQGETVRFSDAIVVLTSNLAGDSSPRVGFGGARAASDASHRAALGKALRPELVARIDGIAAFEVIDAKAALGIAYAHLARATEALIASGRLAPGKLPALRKRVQETIASRTSFAGGAREILRAVEALLVEERPRETPKAPLVVAYPYFGSGRERLAAGFSIELAASVDPEAIANEVLVHDAGGTLLYVAYGTGKRPRLIALCGEASAAEEIAASLERVSAAPAIVATGRVRVDLAGRPIGDLVDKLYNPS
jgi:hypothetical protein